MDRLEMAKALMDTPKATEPGQTVLAYGTATADSANGLVLVDFGGDTVSPDDEQSVEVETTFAVRAGDEVIVSLVGADGTGKTPIVIGVIGRMDELADDISRNYSLVLNEEYSGTDCTITALIYHYSDDITDDYSDRQFVWYKKTEDGKTALGTGKSMTLSIEDMGYGGVIRCEFSSYIEGGYLTTYDGRVITLFDDTPIVVADLGDITLDFNLAQEIAVYDSENKPIAGIDKAANEAYSMAEMTPQHFFHNSQGAFVTSDDVKCDTFTGDGAETSFTLSGTPYSDTLLALYVAGASVTSGYSVSGTALTFSSAPTGSIVALWSATEMQDYAKMDSDSFDIVKATDTVASFGEEVTIGPDGDSQIHLSGNEIKFSDANTDTLLHIFYDSEVPHSVSYNVSFARSIDVRDYITSLSSVVFCEKEPIHGLITPIETIPSVYISYLGTVVKISDDYALPAYTYQPYLDISYSYKTYEHHFALGQPMSVNPNNGDDSLTIGSNDARGDRAFSHGSGNYAIGNNSHAEGYNTSAKGENSHAEGYQTYASSNNQHASGKCNIEDSNGTYVEIVGNGTNHSNRSNARTLDWNGNEKLSGEIDASVRSTTVAGYAGNLHLYRFGRVVFVSTDDFLSKSSSVSSGTVLTQTIPDGFRPISVAVVPKPISTSTNNAFFEFGTDGSITYKGSTGWANATAWSGVWITGDD